MDVQDEPSTGLDSSTTYCIIKYLRDLTHTQQSTTLISLLQPDPETFALFDDVLVLAEGRLMAATVPATSPEQCNKMPHWTAFLINFRLLYTSHLHVVTAQGQHCPTNLALWMTQICAAGHVIYHGPVAEAAGYFGELSFACPERKGIADFLQEVTSEKVRPAFAPSW